jgi:hypothetical protein
MLANTSARSSMWTAGLWVSESVVVSRITITRLLGTYHGSKNKSRVMRRERNSQGGRSIIKVWSVP